MNKIVSIVIPIRNEEMILKKSLKSFNKEIKKLVKVSNYEFIFVLNGSSDNSLKILKESQKKNIKIIKLRKSNYGGALKEGIKNAKSNYVIISNIDIYWDKKFFNWAWKNKKNYAIIIGSKRADPTLNLQPNYRKILSGVLNSLLIFFFDSVVMDTHGVKILNIKKIKTELNSCKMSRGQFDTELVLRCLRSGKSIVEVPTFYKEMRSPRNLMITKIIQNILDLFKLYYLIKKTKFKKNIQYRRLSRHDI